MTVTAWASELRPVTSSSHDPGNLRTNESHSVLPVSVRLLDNGGGRRALSRSSAFFEECPQFIEGKRTVIDTDVVDEATKVSSLLLRILTDEYGVIVDAYGSRRFL